MNLNPTKLKELCRKYNLTPSKKYGQNFLIQDWPIKKMLEAAGVSKNDTVIEIGPGFGVLTFALAERAGRVIAFEIERKLEEYWEEIKDKRYEIRDKIEIKWGNALKKLESYKVESYKVVANLPYQITSNVLRTLLELENPPQSITVMVQKEVAERICAEPGDMSLLSVAVQYYGEPKIVDIVTRGNFWPEPKVDSAILAISKISRVSRLSSERFFRVVKAGFSSKRKQLANNLATKLKVESYKVKSILQEVCGNAKVRAEELPVEDWLRVVEKLSHCDIGN